MAHTIQTTEQFDEWLDGLRDRKGQAVITARILRIQAGLMGDVKSFDGLLEFRIDFGPGYRLYATRRGQEIIILLCGGDKGSQSRDIKKAKDLAAQI